MANKENLKNFKKGDDSRRNLDGRPKKFVSSLKAQGYKSSEINDCIKTMLSMTNEQLGKVEENPQATVLELMIAAAVREAIKRGDLSAMETLVSRTYGKPKETIEITTTPEIEAARALYQNLIEKDGLPKQKALAEVMKAAEINGVELNESDILDADTIG